MSTAPRITNITIKRAYEKAQPQDGYRIFVDRLWPRGLSKQDFKFDLWCKDLAPSPALRTWFGHKVEHWDAFWKSYETELRAPGQKALMRQVLANADQPAITLVYAAKDTEHNHALILAAEMEKVSAALSRKAPT